MRLSNSRPRYVPSYPKPSFPMAGRIGLIAAPLGTLLYNVQQPASKTGLPLAAANTHSMGKPEMTPLIIRPLIQPSANGMPLTPEEQAEMEALQPAQNTMPPSSAGVLPGSGGSSAERPYFHNYYNAYNWHSPSSQSYSPSASSTKTASPYTVPTSTGTPVLKPTAPVSPAVPKLPATALPRPPLQQAAIKPATHLAVPKPTTPPLGKPLATQGFPSASKLANSSTQSVFPRSHASTSVSRGGFGIHGNSIHSVGG